MLPQFHESSLGLLEHGLLLDAVPSRSRATASLKLSIIWVFVMWFSFRVEVGGLDRRDPYESTHVMTAG